MIFGERTDLKIDKCICSSEETVDLSFDNINNFVSTLKWNRERAQGLKRCSTLQSIKDLETYSVPDVLVHRALQVQLALRKISINAFQKEHAIIDEDKHKVRRSIVQMIDLVSQWHALFDGSIV